MKIYYNKSGQAHCGDSLTLIPELFTDRSIDLVITSPPYPLINEKPYGNKHQEEYVEWFLQYIKAIIPKLKETGSIVLDFGNTYVKGMPEINVYQFEILSKLASDYGLHLAMPYYWYNPSRLPIPSVYVSRRKIRPKDKINNLWHLCLDPNICKADTTKVMVPYSKSMKKYFKRYADNPYAWSENEGALPSNLLEIANTNNRTQYHICCRALHIQYQPSVMPQKLVEFFIRMLTEENDVVVDIFAGSNTTGYTADILNRQWISIEQRIDYVAMSAFRFLHSTENAEEIYKRIISNNSIPIDISSF